VNLDTKAKDETIERTAAGPGSACEKDLRIRKLLWNVIKE